jgi:hypothetical protein
VIVKKLIDIHLDDLLAGCALLLAVAVWLIYVLRWPITVVLVVLLLMHYHQL